MPQAQADSPQALIQQLADGLAQAYVTGEPVSPVREAIPDITVADAYAIQQAQVSALTGRWGKIVGHKIGLTSLAMQRQLGVDSPDFGFFTEAQFHQGDTTLNIADFISAKVEPEFAFRITQDLGADATVQDVAAAIGEVYAAIEIIDSRIANWDITLQDTIADNASCGAVVVGAKPLELGVDQLVETSCALVVDGAKTGEGTGADVLGSPLEAVAWLARALAEQGDGLKAGEWVLPGSFTAAAPVSAGSTATADFGQLGQLSVTFQ